MKFDICLMNPPYDNGLHIDFLNKIEEISNKVLSIQPINKFQHAKISNKEFPVKISEIDIVDDANKQFNLSFKYDIGIIIIDENKTLDSSKVSCIPNEDIFYKIKSKNMPLFKSQIKKSPQTKYTLRCTVGGGFDPEHYYNWVSPTFNVAIKQEMNNNIGFVYVKSKKEQINLFKYCHTHFFKFCIIIAQNKLAPWMNDYTQEWTDDKLFKFFNLTQDDINIINNVAGKYDKEIKL